MAPDEKCPECGAPVDYLTNAQMYGEVHLRTHVYCSDPNGDCGWAGAWVGINWPPERGVTVEIDDVERL